jgi:hypothetical protein
MELEIKRFENADEVRTFEKGAFEVVRIGGMTIGRAKYEAGLELVRTCRRDHRDGELRG